MIAENRGTKPGIATRLWRDFEDQCNRQGAAPETWKLIQDAGALLDLWDRAADLARLLRQARHEHKGMEALDPSDGLDGVQVSLPMWWWDEAQCLLLDLGLDPDAQPDDGEEADHG